MLFHTTFWAWQARAGELGIPIPDSFSQSRDSGLWNRDHYQKPFIEYVGTPALIGKVKGKVNFNLL